MKKLMAYLKRCYLILFIVALIIAVIFTVRGTFDSVEEGFLINYILIYGFRVFVEFVRLMCKLKLNLFEDGLIGFLAGLIGGAFRSLHSAMRKSYCLVYTVFAYVVIGSIFNKSSIELFIAEALIISLLPIREAIEPRSTDKVI